MRNASVRVLQLESVRIVRPSYPLHSQEPDLRWSPSSAVLTDLSICARCSRTAGIVGSRRIGLIDNLRTGRDCTSGYARGT